MEQLCVALLGITLPAIGWIMYKLGGIERKVEAVCRRVNKLIGEEDQ